MDELEYRVLLFDFYGEMLTTGQRETYEEHVMEDLTVSEIAQNRGVSRQAVSDLIKRTEKILEGYENKLGLVARFQRIREKTARISEFARQEGQDVLADMISAIPEDM